MLGKCFLKINNTAVPNPVDFSVNHESVENTMTSQSGKDMVNVVRLGKVTFSCTWNCSSFWKDILAGYCLADVVSVEFLGRTYECRCRDFSAKLIENSARTYQTDGLWEVSMNIIEN